MPSYRARRRRGETVTARRLAAGALAAGVWAAACGRDAPAPPAVTTPAEVAPSATVAAPAPALAPAAAVGWDAGAGTALVVPGAAGDALLVVPGVPNSAGVDTARGAGRPGLPANVTLLGADGLVGQARLTAVEGGAGAACAAGPRVRVGPASGADAVPQWTVGLVGASGDGPAPLALHTLADKPGADSAALAASLTRLAAALPEAPGVRPATRAALRGVPFRVRHARGFAPDSATQAVVAVLTRTMNQEAAPAADALLLVAERPAGDARGDAWQAAYAERATGPEEQLPSIAVLAAVRLAGAAGPRAALVTAREGEDGARYGLLERAGPGAWRPRWTSVRSPAGCGR